MQPWVVSVNVGPVRDLDGIEGSTGIDKRPVDGPVRIGELGVAGDGIGDARRHGGIYQAVYAFAREDLDGWGERLGSRLRPGLFGENLTTAGIDVNQALMGETWRVGTALLEVVSVRIPCATFQGWLGLQALDATTWVRRFAAEGRPGPYLRVLEAGTVSAGDALVVEHRPDHDVTVSTLFKALTTDRAQLGRVARMPGLDRLHPDVRERVLRHREPAPAVAGPVRATDTPRSSA